MFKAGLLVHGQVHVHGILWHTQAIVAQAASIYIVVRLHRRKLSLAEGVGSGPLVITAGNYVGSHLLLYFLVHLKLFDGREALILQVKE